MRRSLTLFTLLVGLAAAGSPIGAPQALAEGAVAHGRDGRVGLSYGYRPREAEERALRECGGYCEIVGRFDRQCAAIAVGERGAFGWAAREHPRRAEEDAIQECRAHGGRECRIQVRGCDR
jgi:hypothetical protein